jgi:hypothetical protein
MTEAKIQANNEMFEVLQENMWTSQEEMKTWKDALVSWMDARIEGMKDCREVTEGCLRKMEARIETSQEWGEARSKTEGESRRIREAIAAHQEVPNEEATV